jgi:hypothetical protein
MSNKQQTPVSWLLNQFQEGHKDFGGLDLEWLKRFKTALQMEFQKQQKYDEMLAMLDGMCNVWNEVGINDYSMSNYMNLVQQLVKGAKEL